MTPIKVKNTAFLAAALLLSLACSAPPSAADTAGGNGSARRPAPRNAIYARRPSSSAPLSYRATSDYDDGGAADEYNDDDGDDRRSYNALLSSDAVSSRQPAPRPAPRHRGSGYYEDEEALVSAEQAPPVFRTVYAPAPPPPPPSYATQSAPAYPPQLQPAPYLPRPSYTQQRPVYAPQPEQYNAPAKYDFGYEVRDDYSQNYYGHQESRDGYKRVDYTADEYGYHPVVSYEGQARYPEPSSYRPTYAPAPAPRPQQQYRPEPAIGIQYRAEPAATSYEEPRQRLAYPQPVSRPSSIPLYRQ